MFKFFRGPRKKPKNMMQWVGWLMEYEKRKSAYVEAIHDLRSEHEMGGGGDEEDELTRVCEAAEKELDDWVMEMILADD